VNGRDADGRTGLHVAAAAGNLSIVNLLLRDECYQTFLQSNFHFAAMTLTVLLAMSFRRHHDTQHNDIQHKWYFAESHGPISSSCCFTNHSQGDQSFYILSHLCHSLTPILTSKFAFFPLSNFLTVETS